MTASSHPKARAPASRVYSSEPRLVQKHFARHRVPSLSEPRTVSSKSHRTSESQRTLTQMPDFLVPSSWDDEAEEFKITGEEWSEPNPKKRRRLSDDDDSHQAKRQSTLTQLRWVENSDSDGEDELMDPPQDHDMEAAWDAEAEAMESDTHKPDRRGKDPIRRHLFDDEIHGKENWRAHSSAAHSEGGVNSHSLHFHNHQHPPDPDSPGEGSSRMASVKFLTPSKPIKFEVPSSQSPAASLSTQPTPSSHQSRASQKSPMQFSTAPQMHDASPSVPSRTPLSEIAPNILAQRDEDSAKKYKGLNKKLCTDANFTDAINENIEPEYIIDSDEDMPGSPTPVRGARQSTGKQRATPSAQFEPHAIIPSTPHEIPPSQATTIDELTPSPSPLHMHKLRQRSSSHMPPPPPPARRHFFSSSSQTQPSLPDLASSSASDPGFAIFSNSSQGSEPDDQHVASIYDSADIITATQLCPMSNSVAESESQVSMRF